MPPELSRRLKRQRFWDDHAEAIGNTLMYLAFTAFLLGLSGRDQRVTALGVVAVRACRDRRRDLGVRRRDAHP
jgi:hypothetical protein